MNNLTINILGLICALSVVLGVATLIIGNVIISTICMLLAVYSITAICARSLNLTVIIKDILN
ncbi:MAG: hypothetical protein ACRCXT_11160 [Paraclostridium sp.]